jgi:hypothetical protein
LLRISRLRMRSLLIKELKMQENMRPNSKLRELRMKKKEKSRDSENFKKKPPTDKQKLMP